MSIAFPIRSSRIITTVTPAGPTFFCAPAKRRPNLLTSISSESIIDEISVTRGTFPVSGRVVYLVPYIVLLYVM